MNAFTFAFLTALAAALATRMWLAVRHIRHVRANREAVPASFADRIPLAAHQKAADYTVARTRLQAGEVVTAASVLLLFTLGGGLQWLFDAWAGFFSADTYAHGIALIGSVVLINALVDLPFSLYRTFGVEARFGFNRITARLYIADMIKQALLGIALGAPLLLVVLWLMERMGDLWWLYAWFAWMAFNILILIMFPTVIAPLFNKFSPLEDAALRDRIERLMDKCGFKAKGIFVMDGSRRSSHGNAYFTGLGASKRIVFFDTLLTRLEPAEIEAVLAHELGHFKRRHITKRIGLLFGVSFLFLALLGYVAEQAWFYNGLGVHDRSTAMALLLFVMAMPVFTFFIQPLGNAYSRKHEYEADAFAAGQTNGGELVHALVKLYQDNAATLTPDPLHSAFYDSHPPAGLRIARLQSPTA